MVEGFEYRVVYILLSEEGKVINNMQVGCFIELIVIYFS